jgi:pilus assembly protein CpaE
MCTLFDYIVLDIPQLWAPWTQAALGTADRVALVTQLNVPALHLARRRSEGLIGAVEELNKTDFIVNKFERRSFRTNLKLGDAERALDVPYVDPIGLCHDQVRDSLNRGEPVGVSCPESRFVRDSNEIFEEWYKQSQLRAGNRLNTI